MAALTATVGKRFCDACRKDFTQGVSVRKLDGSDYVDICGGCGIWVPNWGWHPSIPLARSMTLGAALARWDEMEAKLAANEKEIAKLKRQCEALKNKVEAAAAVSLPFATVKKEPPFQSVFDAAPIQPQQPFVPWPAHTCVFPPQPSTTLSFPSFPVAPTPPSVPNPFAPSANPSFTNPAFPSGNAYPGFNFGQPDRFKANEEPPKTWNAWSVPV